MLHFTNVHFDLLKATQQYIDIPALSSLATSHKVGHHSNSNIVIFLGYCDWSIRQNKIHLWASKVIQRNIAIL